MKNIITVNVNLQSKISMIIVIKYVKKTNTLKQIFRKRKIKLKSYLMKSKRIKHIKKRSRYLLFS